VHGNLRNFERVVFARNTPPQIAEKLVMCLTETVAVEKWHAAETFYEE
jgi:hypothetical protein